MSWVVGLKKLGFDVYFVEQIDSRSCVDARGQITAFRKSENLRYFEKVTRNAGLEHRSALIYDGGRDIAGLSRVELLDVAREVVFLLNISGNLTVSDIKNAIRCKAYLDLDPGFTQFWHASGDLDPAFEEHDHYFTIGENIGHASCSIPSDGVRWRTTRQPVVLEQWPPSPNGDPARFTTIAAWRGPYGPVESGGKRYGLKVHEFRKLLELPRRVAASFELALDIHPDDALDRKALEDHGWHIVDPRLAVPDPDSFRGYVQQSGAEFSVAKEIYVETRSGWFSDRSVRYLASGKPALVQDTGLDRHYPVGEGLMTFGCVDEAVQGAERIIGNYPAHSKAARRIAEEYFDSEKVLGRLIRDIGVSA